MQPPFPSPVATWHNDTYPAINPSNPELIQDGKTVIITGAGSGIGRATALAFAQGGAKHIILIGRTEATLDKTSKEIGKVNSNVRTSIFVASVTDESAVSKITEDVGAWDVLILNAGHLSPPDNVLNIPVDEFWSSFETNVKSIYIFAQAFIPHANPSATLLSVNAAGCVLPANVGVGLTGYMTSKVASLKLIEFLAHEHPEMFIASVHPGVVDTKLFRQAELSESKLPRDIVELPAHYMLWLAGKGEKGYLRGRMLWCNWDVGELEEMGGQIKRDNLFTVGMMGWPFGEKDKFGQTGSVR